MPEIKNKIIFILILLFSIFALFAAYFIQYVLEHQPCNLCLIERIPYIFSIIIISIILFTKKFEKISLITLSLIFFSATLIATYHFGIEQGFIDETSVCGTGNVDFITKDEILKSLLEVNISCKDVTFRIFSLSLTLYNILLSILVFLISLKIYLINNDNKK